MNTDLLKLEDAKALRCVVNEINARRCFTKHAYGWLCHIELRVQGPKGKARAVADELGTDKNHAYGNALREAEKAVPYCFADAADIVDVEKLTGPRKLARETEAANRRLEFDARRAKVNKAYDDLLKAAGLALEMRESSVGYKVPRDWYQKHADALPMIAADLADEKCSLADAISRTHALVKSANELIASYAAAK